MRHLPFLDLATARWRVSLRSRILRISCVYTCSTFCLVLADVSTYGQFHSDANADASFDDTRRKCSRSTLLPTRIKGTCTERMISWVQARRIWRKWSDHSQSHHPILVQSGPWILEYAQMIRARKLKIHTRILLPNDNSCLGSIARRKHEMRNRYHEPRSYIWHHIFC